VKIITKIVVGLVVGMVVYGYPEHSFCSIPVMSYNNGEKEVVLDVFDTCGGTPAGGWDHWASTLQSCCGELAGIGNYTGTGKEVDAGYFSPVFPPSAVTNLCAVPSKHAYWVDLCWSCPGAVLGSSNLAAGSTYFIQVSSYVIPVSAWDKINAAISIATGPVVMGTTAYFIAKTTSSQVSFPAYMLEEDVTYYYRLWTMDDEANISDISNGATAYATAPFIGVEVDDEHVCFNFGDCCTGQTYISTAALVVRNIGNVEEDYILNVSSESTVWKIAETPYSNQCAVNAVFHAEKPINTSFALDDLLTTNQVRCSAVAYTVDDAGPEEQQTGTWVPLDTDRNLWVKLRTPIATISTDNQVIPIVITCESPYE